MKRLSLVLCIIFAATFLISGCTKTYHKRKGSPVGEMKGSPKGGADCTCKKMAKGSPKGADCACAACACVEGKGSPKGAPEKKGS